MLVLAGFVGFYVCITQVDFSELHSAVANLSEEDEAIRELHENFMAEHGRKYLTKEEKLMRFQIFAHNYKQIMLTASQVTHKVGINKFADMTHEEFKLYTGLNKVARKSHEQTHSVENVRDADIDWQAKGAVAKVKDQGQCGSCYAFSGICALEGLYVVKGSPLTTFSEQEIVDCSKSFGNDGCDGGWMDQVFNYTMVNGIHKDADYKYTGRVQKCKADKTSAIFVNKGWKDVAEKDLNGLQSALQVNVVSVAVCAEANAFMYYTSGIIKKGCCLDLDHGVSLTASGVDGTTPFWRIRNSWGASWGEKGYVRFLKETGTGNGMCGIALAASYPTA